MGSLDEAIMEANRTPPACFAYRDYFAMAGQKAPAARSAAPSTRFQFMHMHREASVPQESPSSPSSGAYGATWQGAFDILQAQMHALQQTAEAQLTLRLQERQAPAELDLRLRKLEAIVAALHLPTLRHAEDSFAAVDDRLRAVEAHRIDGGSPRVAELETRVKELADAMATVAAQAAPCSVVDTTRKHTAILKVLKSVTGSSQESMDHLNKELKELVAGGKLLNSAVMRLQADVAALQRRRQSDTSESRNGSAGAARIQVQVAQLGLQVQALEARVSAVSAVVHRPQAPKVRGPAQASGSTATRADRAQAGTETSQSQCHAAKSSQPGDAAPAAPALDPAESNNDDIRADGANTGTPVDSAKRGAEGGAHRSAASADKLPKKHNSRIFTQTQCCDDVDEMWVPLAARGSRATNTRNSVDIAAPAEASGAGPPDHARTGPPPASTASRQDSSRGCAAAHAGQATNASGQKVLAPDASPGRTSNSQGDMCLRTADSDFAPPTATETPSQQPTAASEAGRPLPAAAHQLSAEVAVEQGASTAATLQTAPKFDGSWTCDEARRIEAEATALDIMRELHDTRELQPLQGVAGMTGPDWQVDRQLKLVYSWPPGSSRPMLYGKLEQIDGSLRVHRRVRTVMSRFCQALELQCAPPPIGYGKSPADVVREVAQLTSHAQSDAGLDPAACSLFIKHLVPDASMPEVDFMLALLHANGKGAVGTQTVLDAVSDHEKVAAYMVSEDCDLPAPLIIFCGVAQEFYTGDQDRWRALLQQAGSKRRKLIPSQFCSFVWSLLDHTKLPRGELRMIFRVSVLLTVEFSCTALKRISEADFLRMLAAVNVKLVRSQERSAHPDPAGFSKTQQNTD